MKYIDNVDFAKKSQTIADNIEVSALSRANEVFEKLSGKLSYIITGSVDNQNKPILAIRIYGKITALCQNCLEKLDIPIEHSNVIPIFYTESDMDNALFGEDVRYTDGILADDHFDIDNFIEDELIMLLPIAPKHKTCKSIAYHDKPESPFSVLIK